MVNVRGKFVEILGGKCEVCGYHKIPNALLFWYPNPEHKWYHGSQGWMFDIERFYRDCKSGFVHLLCENCFRISIRPDIDLNKKRYMKSLGNKCQVCGMRNKKALTIKRDKQQRDIGLLCFNCQKEDDLNKR
jgi:hypothetical protein